MMLKLPHPYTGTITAGIIVMIAGCSPAPKYRAHTHEKKTPRTAAKKAPVVKHETGIPFEPPVRNFQSRRITSPFGMRRNPEYNVEEFHRGIDIKAQVGEEVLASASGTVTFSGNQRGFGRVIIIEHIQRFTTVYAHLSGSKVERGDWVYTGEVIGTVGKSGNATGSHLHFEIRKGGTAVNPLDYL